MTNSESLPNGWARADLGDVADFVMGQAPPGAASNFSGKGTIFVKAGEFGQLRPVVREWTTHPLKFAREGDVLICVVGATAGKLNLGIDCAIGRSVAAIRPSGRIPSDFVLNQLLPMVPTLRANSAGSAQGVISQRDLSNIPFLLPPLNEQRRIVAKIEELTTHSRRAREALDSIPALLDHFRQSVLSAAFRGDLTADWRANRGLPDNPYKQTALRDLVREPLRNGKSVKDGDGPKVLRLSSLRNGEIDWTESKCGDWDDIDVNRFLIEDGDFLVARGNGSKDLVGRGGLVSGTPPKMAFPDTMIRIRTDPFRINPRFLKLFWNSKAARRHIELAARTSAGIWKISQPDLEALLVTVPDLTEQEEIVRIVEELLGYLESLIASCESARANIERLSESILTKAFRGELVPQDPNDEPASVLLERIKAERAEAVVPKAKRGRQPKSKVEV